MANQWFRWYEGTCEDGKFRMIARNAGVTLRDVIAVWALILEGASSSENRGDLRFEEDYIAAVLDFSQEEIDRIFSAFVEAKLINVGPVGGYVTNWDKRQFSTDKQDSTNAERQKRYRENQKRNGNDALRNDSVTEKKRPDTETDTEKRKNTKKEKSGKLPKPENVTPETWRDFNRQRKAPLTETALGRIIAEAEKAGMTLEAALQECCARGWQGFKAEWMNKTQGNRNAPSTDNRNHIPQAADVMAGF